MDSDDPRGADNQQERPSRASWLDEIPSDLGHYMAGFVDGEGSFNVPIRRSPIGMAIQAGRHPSASGIKAIVELRAPMNRGGKGRYRDDEIIVGMGGWESSEAIRKAPS